MEMNTTSNAMKYLKPVLLYCPLRTAISVLTSAFHQAVKESYVERPGTPSLPLRQLVQGTRTAGGGHRCHHEVGPEAPLVAPASLHQRWILVVVLLETPQRNLNPPSPVP